MEMFVSIPPSVLAQVYVMDVHEVKIFYDKLNACCWLLNASNYRGVFLMLF